MSEGQAARTPASRTAHRIGRRSFAATGVAAVALLVLAGCKVDQQKEVALYRDVLDARVPQVPAYEADEPLSVQRAMSLANQNNEQVALSGEDYVQALIQKNRIAATFLPTVAFQPGYTIEEKPRGSQAANIAGFKTSGSTAYAFQAPVVGSMNLFRGGGDAANLDAAESIIRQRRELLLDMQATVLLNVAEVYYQVIRSEHSVDVLQNNLAVQKARLADVENQFHNGLATQLSVAQTQAQVAATRVTLVQSEADVANGRSTLAQLIGVPAVTGPLTDGFAVPDERPPETGFEAMAVDGREDLHAAVDAIDAAHHRVDAAIAEYYPSVSLNVAGFLYREYYSDATRWTALLSANLPIFSAGTIRADVRDAWSFLRQAALDESATRRAVLHDVQTAYTNLVAGDRRIKGLEDEVQASQDAFHQAQAGFANGLATNLDVLTAQDQLLTAQLQLTSATFDRSIFYLDLVRSTGRLHKVAVGGSRGGRPGRNSLPGIVEADTTASGAPDALAGIDTPR